MVLKEMVVVKFIKMLFVMFLLVFFTSVPVIASETEDYFDEIIYIENQIGAVSIEMHGCLGWFSDDSETVKTASEQAIKDLNEIEDHLLSMNTPKKFKEITDLDIQIISLLKKGYSGIESKDDETIGRESSEFIKVLGKYREAFKEALEKYRFWVKLPEDFDPLNEELMTAGSQEEKLAYKKAIDLMDKRNFKEAYPILLGLKKKAENSSFKDCVLLKISDCLLMTDSNLDNIESMKPDKEGLSILSDIIKKSSYSPVVYKSFYKWRTIDQYYNNGMSNMSEIPNKEYNIKKWQLVQMIKEYINNYPDDLWAREQVDLLLSLPNITRGGSFGNNNLANWGSLYGSPNKD